MATIMSIKAREILSSGGTPSLEVKATLDTGAVGTASVPYGASAGVHEAFVLLDNDPDRYMGKGMLKAVANINEIIGPEITGRNPFNQGVIDKAMIEIDGTPNKQKLGANAILGVSMAVAKAAAKEKGLPLYAYIHESFNLPVKKWRMPNPMMVVIEGGKHADQSTDFQEYLISPVGGVSAKENVRYGIEVYFHLKEILKKKGYNTTVGNEGAFAPAGLKTNEAPLNLLIDAIKASGFIPGGDVGISVDPAVSEIVEDGFYLLNKENRKLSSEEMNAYFADWVERYPLITLEDTLHEDDWEWWPKLTEQLGDKLPIIGDDLIVTNPLRLKRAIAKKAINAVLIKLNQIGTLSETIETCMLAREHGMMTVVSHRGGGETNDTSMVDLAVAVGSGFIKVGPTRGERVSKYNRLMEIEEELGDRAAVAGKNFKEVV